VPRNRVVNRRNVPGSARWRTIWLSEEGMATLADLAKQLEVTQGSVLEVAIRELAAQSPPQVVALLHQHKQLTDDETKYVLDRLHRGRA
jgi:Mn-dependent DtxR family transcriptional regulator